MGHSEAGSGTLEDAVIDCIAGSLGAVALVYVGQPMDTIKVKMQTFPNKYQGTMHCLRETITKEGFRGLYAGTVPSIIANIAENSVLFAGYGACQKAIGWTFAKKPEELGVWENATAGSVASFFSSFALCPTELIKCRAQALREKWERDNVGSSKGKFRVSPLKLTHEVIQKEGPAGLFRGLSATVAREVPGYFFFFGGYELSREILAPPGVLKEDIGPWRTMFAGAMGGAVFWLVMFPVDVVKSRIQIEGLQERILPMMKRIAVKEGSLLNSVFCNCKDTCNNLCDSVHAGRECSLMSRNDRVSMSLSLMRKRMAELHIWQGVMLFWVSYFFQNEI